MYLVNGKPEKSVSLSDRSFQYGDGCFTTILTKYGVPQYWSLHVERMQACLDVLGISCPDWVEVKSWLDLTALDHPMAGIKIHISRGSGGRGYSPAGLDSCAVTIHAFSYPSHYAKWKHEGVELGVCKTTLGIMPLLAGHKHNNRLEQVLLKREIEQRGYEDGIVCDIKGHVIETTMANLFWVKDMSLYTPQLNNSGVAGVMRKMILQFAQSCDMKIHIEEFTLEHIQSADEVFMTNALLEVAPVVKMGDLLLSIGTATRRFQEMVSS